MSLAQLEERLALYRDLLVKRDEHVALLEKALDKARKDQAYAARLVCVWQERVTDGR